MLTFEERMKLLEKALSKHTPESLFKELSSFPKYGPTIVNFSLEEKKKNN